MYKNIRLSIGIPTYNQSDYLEQTIKSLLAQTVDPYEIVVSNNFSTDNTSQILDKYKDKIKIIQPDYHMSMMEHWNFLISNMTGEWITLISSDDLLKPKFTEEVLKAISEHSDAILIRGGMETIDFEGNIVGRSLLRSTKKKTTFPKNLIEQLFGPKVSFASFSIKKEIYEKVNGFPSKLQLYGDWGLWLLLAEYGSFISIKKAIAQYRTEYRPLNKKREIQQVYDHFYIYNTIIYQIYKKYPKLLNMKQFDKFNKISYLKRMATVSQTLNESDKKKTLECLEEWAHIVRDKMYIKKYKNNEIIKSNHNKFKAFVSRIFY